MHKVWVTVVGTSVFAVVNPIWACCRTGDYIPEKVYLIVDKKVRDNAEKVKNILKVLLSEFGKSPEIVEKICEETDFKRLISTIGEVIKREKLAGNEVAVDMTPGRKFMSAIMMYSGLGENVEHRADRVYYLHLEERDYTNIPWIKIPIVYQKLYEMKRSLLK
jgi:CRISPR/Cas system-associated protein Csm6